MWEHRGKVAQRVLSWGVGLTLAFSLMHLGGFFVDPLISKSASLPAYRRNGLHRVSAFCLYPAAARHLCTLHCSPQAPQSPRCSPFTTRVSCSPILCTPAVTAGLCQSKMTRTGDRSALSKVHYRTEVPALNVLQDTFQRDAGVPSQRKSFALYPGAAIAGGQETWSCLCVIRACHFTALCLSFLTATCGK